MPRILSVGQCGYDHGKISRELAKAIEAKVEGADTFDEALDLLKAGGFDLVLVNRVTDSDGTSGLDLIGTLKADPALSALPVILVSNFPDAQTSAQALGALPGFGKSDLGTPTARERLTAALGQG